MTSMPRAPPKVEGAQIISPASVQKDGRFFIVTEYEEAKFEKRKNDAPYNVGATGHAAVHELRLQPDGIRGGKR